MDKADLHDAVSDLSTTITNLGTALNPLICASLSTTASKLPLLDKAKLHILATYALESILFNSLRLNGTDAKAHAVFAELNRVKEYFAKIKAAEGGGAGNKPTARVDKDAVGRFVRAGLAGNERVDRESREARAKERAGAKRKLEEMGTSGVGTASMFEGGVKRARTEGQAATGPLEANEDVSGEEDGEGGVTLGERVGEKKSKRKNKPTDPEKKALKRERRAKAKEAKLSPHGSSDALAEQEQEDDQGGDESTEQHKAKISKPPKSSKEALESLLDGASSKLEKKGNGKKKKRSKGQVLEDERADEMK